MTNAPAKLINECNFAIACNFGASNCSRLVKLAIGAFRLTQHTLHGVANTETRLQINKCRQWRLLSSYDEQCVQCGRCSQRWWVNHYSLPSQTRGFFVVRGAQRGSWWTVGFSVLSESRASCRFHNNTNTIFSRFSAGARLRVSQIRLRLIR